MDRTDGSRLCSVTVHLRQTAEASGRGILFEACRVGSVDASDGRMTLNWNLGELTSMRPSDSTENMTKKLSAMIFMNGDAGGKTADTGAVPEADRRRAVTDENGVCVFKNLEQGVWLIHASDSSSYGTVEDTLAAVPCFVEEQGHWTGPVYDADIWPKGDIRIKSPEVGTPTEDRPEYGSRTEKTVTGYTTLSGSTQTDRGKSVPPGDEKKRKDKGMDTGLYSERGSAKPVRTLDDTPLSGLICALLVCALAIGLILARLKKRSGRDFIHMMPAISMAVIIASGLCVHTAAQDVEQQALILDMEKSLEFVNESSDTPCLTVSKEVLDAENSSPAPENDSFVFILRINNKRAARLPFRIFTESGEELVDMTGSGTDSLTPAVSARGPVVTLRTGADGSFTLKNGQYALFEDVSRGDVFEVAECEADGYERVVPSSAGVISGTIEKNGSRADFVNRYAPPPDTDFSDTVLEITKKILWPEDLSIPVRGSFRIRVMTDGKPLANKRVELYEDGSSTPDYSMTDDDGIFEIRGGQRACIRSIPYGADIMTQELCDRGDAMFYPAENQVWRGSAASVVKVTVTNRLADFVVKKRLNGEAGNDSFVFCLLDSADKPIKGAAYYIADDSGELAEDGLEHTDEQGHFLLKDGQRAVFCGLGDKAAYSVREEKMLGYRQVIPESPDGYRHLTVGSSVPVLLFENERSDVNLSSPSAGGGGIMMIIAVASAGMLVSVLVYHRKERK